MAKSRKAETVFSLFQATPSDGPDQHDRVFVPSNREDALHFIAGLIIPDRPVEGFSCYPAKDGCLSLITGGMRASERHQLEAGNPRRFPILLELTDFPAAGSVIGLPMICRLCFRSQDELDDFRFRPVAECDPAAIATSVEPALFDLDGPPRFSPGQVEPEAIRRYRFADRITGGIATMLDLAERLPDAARHVSVFLSGTASPGIAEVADLLATVTATGALDCRTQAVLHAFFEAGSQSRRELIEDVAERIGVLSPDAEIEEADGRWFDYALALLNNDREIDPRAFQDKPPHALRSALLAVMASNVEGLCDLYAGIPGIAPGIVAMASFLQGLRSGVFGLPWSRKAARLDLLSGVTADLSRCTPSISAIDLGFTTKPSHPGPGAALHWRNTPVIVLQGEDAPPTVAAEGVAPADAGQEPARKPARKRKAVADIPAPAVVPECTPPVLDAVPVTPPPSDAAGSGPLHAGLAALTAAPVGATSVLELDDGSGAAIPVLTAKILPNLVSLKRKKDFGKKLPTAKVLADLNRFEGALWRVATEGKTCLMLAELMLPCDAAHLGLLVGKLKEVEQRVQSTLSD